MNTRRLAVTLLLTMCAPWVSASAQTASSRQSSPEATLSHATKAAAPAARWSVRMADASMTRNPLVFDKWDYTAGLMLTAIARVGAETRAPRFDAYVQKSLDKFIGADGSIATYKVEEFNLDQINMGRALFAAYDRTRAPRYRTALKTLREQLARQPRTSEQGFWHKNIYPNQMWLDGLYMAEPFYVEYVNRFGPTSDFDDITRQFLLVARHTRDPRTGLFYHAWDATRTQPWADPITGNSRNFWGRAIGWYLMAAMDVLERLPRAHKDRDAIVRIVQDLAESVARVQDPITGLWWQVLDQPARDKNYLEGSASSMFVYAFARGAKLGLLPLKFHAIASRGFDGLIQHLVRIDSDGMPSLTGICKVAGLGGTPPRDGSYEYYVSEPVVANDYKGVGPFILAALELRR